MAPVEDVATQGAIFFRMTFPMWFWVKVGQMRKLHMIWKVKIKQQPLVSVDIHLVRCCNIRHRGILRITAYPSSPLL